jgi:hypothetical protein
MNLRNNGNRECFDSLSHFEKQHAQLPFQEFDRIMTLAEECEVAQEPEHGNENEVQHNHSFIE